jgi:hypothetical protein
MRISLDIHLLARHGVERAERLVHQHDLGIVHQRAADRGTLLHAAGELPWQLLLEPFEPDQFQQRLRPRQIFVARQLLHVDRQHHVGQDVAPGQQQRVLEHDADIAVRLCHLLAFDQISPVDGASSPEIIFSSVDLPQPDGPTTTKNSPSLMWKSSGRSDGTSPSRER